jgi:hypothetical protein
MFEGICKESAEVVRKQPDCSCWRAFATQVPKNCTISVNANMGEDPSNLMCAKSDRRELFHVYWKQRCAVLRTGCGTSQPQWIRYSSQWIAPGSQAPFLDGIWNGYEKKTFISRAACYQILKTHD